jgi:transposase
VADPQQAFPGQAQMKPEQAKIGRLKEEVAKLKMERDSTPDSGGGFG